MPERDVDVHSGRCGLRLANHLSIGLLTANAVAAREHRQGTQCLQGRRQAFELFALVMYLLPLRRNQALLQCGHACMQEANLHQWAEMSDGRLTAPDGLAGVLVGPIGMIVAGALRSDIQQSLDRFVTVFSPS